MWTLRPYLAGAVGVGCLAWLVYPFVRRQQPRTFVVAGLGILVVGGVLAATQGRRLDEMEHELFYRQTVTRMETLGRLYAEKPPLDEPMQLPYRPGAAIAIPDPNSGWLLAGVVVNSIQPGFVQVELTDDSVAQRADRRPCPAPGRAHSATAVVQLGCAEPDGGLRRATRHQ